MEEEQRPSVCGEVVDILKKHFGDDLIAVALFGSAAREQVSQPRDWDFFVLIENLPSRHFRRCTLLNELVLPRVSQRVSLVAKTPAEFLASFPPLYLDLGLDARVLYDPTGFFTRQLNRIRQIIRQAGLRRVERGGDFAWRWRQPPRRGWEITWEGYRELE
ncbi:MAG: nucleotidyltransferase domain-containing protein [Anaerolineae bacterium]|nr:nucleotidyltransferase domain-containing protein [Anaerolineae bacterium]